MAALSGGAAQSLRSKSGSLAMFDAMRPAASFVRNLALTNLCNQASYVSLVASNHKSFLRAPNWSAPAIDGESAGSMCDMPQARHSKV
jgi:hypothetical protein